MCDVNRRTATVTSVSAEGYHESLTDSGVKSLGMVLDRAGIPGRDLDGFPLPFSDRICILVAQYGALKAAVESLASADEQVAAGAGAS